MSGSSLSLYQQLNKNEIKSAQKKHTYGFQFRTKVLKALFFSKACKIVQRTIEQQKKIKI